jgi:hypothetical protein
MDMGGIAPVVKGVKGMVQRDGTGAFGRAGFG